MWEWDATCIHRSRKGSEAPWLDPGYPGVEALSPSPFPSPSVLGIIALGQVEAGLQCTSLCVLGEVGLFPAQIQLRTLVPFLLPFPLPGTRRLAAARPVTMVTTAWLPVGGGAQSLFNQSVH